MSDYIKLFTSPAFEREDFADMLCEINVECAPVGDGVILNRVQFNQVPAARMPVWAWLNRDDILSPLHTREATMREYRDADSKWRGIELLGYYCDSAFSAWEFGHLDGEMYARYVYSASEYEYVGEWEHISDYDIVDVDGTMVYHLRGGLDILSCDITRV